VKAASSYDRVYAVVRRVPRGRVATYGQVARLAGLANGARQAGYALHALRPHTAVPWHRVLSAAGRISLGDVAGAVTQRLLLEREGVRFDATGRVDLERYQWKARATRRA
jgi:methylated-DNA-protein-cysteine methyltransferase-like protein